MYKYPYGDSQQLNLDWIISKIKELEAGGGTDLEEVSNALIALEYNPGTLYARYDYAFLNGKLYRCLSGTSGTFDPDAWQEALIGDDLAILTRWINAINAAAVVDVKFDTSGTNGKIQQKYNDTYHDVVEVDYTPIQNSKRPLSSNAGYELNGAINSRNTKALSRKATVSFIFDDGNANDSIVKSIFDTHGHKCGFAVYAPINSRYVNYHNDGFEILAHANAYPSTPTEANIKSMLETAYNNVVTAVGECHGWVTPSSTMDAEFRPLVQNYYGYGYTVSKGNVSDVNSAVMLPTTATYELWRSSLESLTLAQCKAIIDKAVLNKRMVCFYGHTANIDNGGNFTSANLNELLTYCETNKVAIETPCNSVANFLEYKPNNANEIEYGEVLLYDVVDNNNYTFIKRNGKICEGVFNADSVTWGDATWQNKFRVPIGFRPPRNVTFFAIHIETGAVVALVLGSNGYVQAYKNTNITKFRGHLTYICDSN